MKVGPERVEYTEKRKIERRLVRWNIEREKET